MFLTWPEKCLCHCQPIGWARPYQNNRHRVLKVRFCYNMLPPSTELANGAERRRNSELLDFFSEFQLFCKNLQSFLRSHPTYIYYYIYSNYLKMIGSSILRTGVQVSKGSFSMLARAAPCNAGCSCGRQGCVSIYCIAKSQTSFNTQSRSISIGKVGPNGKPTFKLIADSESPQDISPHVKGIMEGNKKWVSRMLEKNPDYFTALAQPQKPKFLYFGCADSRVPANEILGLG
jgi:hypothetical protein